MKPAHLPLAAVLAAAAGAQSADRLLAAAEARLAPDRRTVVFDVTPRLDGDRLTLHGEVHDAALRGRLLAFLRENSDLEIVADELIALPDPALGDETVAVVDVSVANLRSKPAHSAELGTQALLGMPLRILKRDRGWYYVQTPNDYLCWTTDRIEVMRPAEYRAWVELPKVVVTATFGVVRRGPGADAPPVSDVVAGCVLALEGEADGSYAVRYPGGRRGHLARTAATPLADWLAAADATPENLVATARRFTGVPYLWGGTSTKGMDCSGFTGTVFLLNGLIIPRDASQQVRAGTPVPIDDLAALRAGDLLFFGRRAAAGSRERVTHVGISLGGARFIHCADDVRVDSLDPADPSYSEARRRSLLYARRLAGDPTPAGVTRLADHPYYRGDEH